MIYKVPMIVVTSIYNADNVEIGKQYLDSELTVTSLSDFFDQIHAHVLPTTSVILYRQDVKQFAKRLEIDNDMANVFKCIKYKLRAEYQVFKLRHNPRTLEFYGINTAFIIHQV